MNPVPHDFSPLGLFLTADPVVKAVMIGLALASIACWAVIFEKSFAIRRLRREARALAAASVTPSIVHEGASDLTSVALRAGLPEWRIGQGAQETDGEFRARLDSAMRKAVLKAIRNAEPGLQILATTGSVAPFVGLFGTVWGIMNSFTAIAGMQNTNLAVVAPGIAEALFATAMGLVAAIPAVLIYNMLSSNFAKFAGRLEGFAAEFGAILARQTEAAAQQRAPAAAPVAE
jgi:biopolymer transport protein ExbB/TolQ